MTRSMIIETSGGIRIYIMDTAATSHIEKVINIYVHGSQGKMVVAYGFAKA